MKQVLQYMKTGETKVVDVPVPQVKKKTALVRTSVSLVSTGTERSLVEFAEKNLIGKATSRPDLMKQVLNKAKREGILSTVESALNRLDQPLMLGYSSAGVIIDVGEGLKGFKVGDRVVCAGGNHAVHAEYAIIPQNLLAHLPDDVDFESGAFATLGAIALNGIRLANLQIGENVAIVGLGLLGLLTAKLVLANGCLVTGIDVDSSSMKFAKKHGISCINRNKIKSQYQSATKNRGYDAVLICAATASNDTVELAGEIVRDRGSVISLGVVGLDLPRKPFFEKEIFFQVSRSSGPGRYDKTYEEEGEDYPLGYVRWTEGRNLEAFVNLIDQGKIEVSSLTTHHIPIEKAEQAYDLITGKKQEPYLGILLTYQGKKQKLKSVIEFPSSGKKQESVAVGVIGAGNYAKATFLPVLQKASGCSLEGIASINGVNAQYSARKFGFRYATSSSEEIINDKKTNTVVIMTRHNDHAQLTQKALRKVKNVYCEKPLALTLKELQEIEKLISRKNSPYLMVGFNRRFAPLSLDLAEFLNASSEPMYMHYRVNAGYLPPGHWLHDLHEGGGRLIGEGCHFIDYLTFLSSSKPISIQVNSLPDQGKYHQDNLQIVLEFANGSIGSIAYLANGDKSYPKEYLEIFCGGKIAILDNYRKLEMVQNGNRKVIRSAFKQDKGHQNAWQAFVDAIQSGSKVPIPYDQIVAVHKAAIMGMKSLKEKRTVEIN